MAMYRSYIIIATVCLCVVALLAGVMIATGRPDNSTIDILEESEIVEVVEADETVGKPIPEMRTIAKRRTDIPRNYVAYEEPSSAEPTEPPVVETEPTETVTESPIVEPETTPIIEETKPTEPIPDPTEAPVVEEEITKDPYDPVELLACVIYQEAGSDNICDDCRYRVADVVLNRVEDSRFPDTIHGVLTQSGQYGNYSRTGVVWPSRANNSGERHAVQRAYNIAMSVVAGTHSELYGNGYVWQAQFVQGSDNIYCCNHYYGR